MTEFVYVTAVPGRPEPARRTRLRLVVKPEPCEAREASESTVVACVTHTATDRHLRACLDRAGDQRWWESADVLYFERAITAGVLLGRLREYPGCAVCVGPAGAGGVIAAIRPGTGLYATQLPDEVPAPSALVGSVLHALLVSRIVPVTKPLQTAAG